MLAIITVSGKGEWKVKRKALRAVILITVVTAIIVVVALVRRRYALAVVTLEALARATPGVKESTGALEGEVCADTLVGAIGAVVIVIANLTFLNARVVVAALQITSSYL